MSALPSSLRAALARPAPPGGLDSIRHVVFFMQENRSFDHYFGTLRGVRGFGDRNAVMLPAGRPVFEQSGVLPYSVRAGTGDRDLTEGDLQYVEGVDHEWDTGQRTRGDGWHDGWIAGKGPGAMVHFDRRELPFQFELADAFTLCDAYHCSMFGPTNPNRLYHWSGTVGHEPSGRRTTANDACAEDTHPGYAHTSFPERLTAAGKTWRVYQEWDNYQCNSLDFFTSFKRVARAALSHTPHRSLHSFYTSIAGLPEPEREEMLAALEKGVAQLTPADLDAYRRGLSRVAPGRLATSFRADVAEGRLPQVSYIVAPEAYSEHPDPSSPAHSAGLVYEILDALASHPSVWERTALFLTFDENDGFYDHVPPPLPPEGTEDEFIDGLPIGLGYRVPMTVVSPWTAGGHVCSEVFDHTSTIRFVERWLGVAEPNISSWRRRVAGDLTSAFDFTPAFDSAAHPVPTSAPAAPEETGPPTAAAVAIPPFRVRWPATPPAEGRLAAQEPGTRPARPLPYRPEASAVLADDGLIVTMTDVGDRGSHFALYPYAGEFASPRHFDVLGAEVVTVPAGAEGYRLTLTGPNGFRREFAGSRTGPAARVAVSSCGAGHRLSVTIANPGPVPLAFTLEALAYGSGRREVLVAAGDRTVLDWDTASGWYDLRLTVAEDPSFHRRMMGHLENGHAGVSG
ncbi:phosphocholine-specific phospholipase C [Microtetraspora fusca]|uniref:phosphocholine-specific phospholipase C n=1 Tax=Microtetraspora fusca TaxID=1997 RepID=UPI000837900C|nr:phospholipase C, phosphocholine-specific [Microtetraspora fusca]